MYGADRRVLNTRRGKACWLAQQIRKPQDLPTTAVEALSSANGGPGPLRNFWPTWGQKLQTSTRLSAKTPTAITKPGIVAGLLASNKPTTRVAQLGLNGVGRLCQRQCSLDNLALTTRRLCPDGAIISSLMRLRNGSEEITS